MSQVFAILQDSLRELRSRSLFWISIGVSVLVSLVLFGLIRFEDTGWGFLWFATNESDIVVSGSYATEQLLSWLFGGAFVYWWLSWGAIIVALLTTASIMPDFVASGSIDLAVAKPIGRVKLFLLKVFGALLFMLLQVTIGVLLAYLLMGLRFDMWFHAALWSIPLLTIQFLYLYAVMALVGIVTRSSLASLLIVLLFWFAISVVQFGANQVNSNIAQAEADIHMQESRIAAIHEAATDESRELNEAEQRQIQTFQRRMQPSQSTLEFLEPWESRVNTLVLFVPKTGDIQKIIAEQVEAPTFNELIMALNGFDAEAVAMMSGMEDTTRAEDMQRAGIAGSRAIREVATFRSLGSSMVFTGLTLLIATVLFCRRDF